MGTAWWRASVCHYDDRDTAGPLKCLSQTARLHECMRARVSLGVSTDTRSLFWLCYVLAVLERPTGLKYDGSS